MVNKKLYEVEFQRYGEVNGKRKILNSKILTNAYGDSKSDVYENFPNNNLFGNDSLKDVKINSVKRVGTFQSLKEK